MCECWLINYTFYVSQYTCTQTLISGIRSAVFPHNICECWFNLKYHKSWRFWPFCKKRKYPTKHISQLANDIVCCFILSGMFLSQTAKKSLSYYHLVSGWDLLGTPFWNFSFMMRLYTLWVSSLGTKFIKLKDQVSNDFSQVIRMICFKKHSSL